MPAETSGPIPGVGIVNLSVLPPGNEKGYVGNCPGCPGVGPEGFVEGVSILEAWAEGSL